jgi:hypothetical protein
VLGIEQLVSISKRKMITSVPILMFWREATLWTRGLKFSFIGLLLNLKIGYKN